MHGPVEHTGREQRVDAAGRHRGRQPMPPLVLLALPVAGLLAVLGGGAALLPSSLTGPGIAAERPEAAVAALAPGAGGGAPGAGTDSPRVRATTPPAAPKAPAKAPAKTPPRKAKPAPKKTTAPAKKRPPETTSAPKVPAGLAGQETEVIRLVNVERDKAGCGSVRLDKRLRSAIRLHVRELGTHGDLYISHVSDDGRDFVQRAKAQGYDDPGGENVARGQRDAADVMKSWMNSEGHRANILNCDFKAMGAGAVKGVDGTIVWGQLFGRS
ncbi:CAP domain-containing protein [Actinoplanes sp. NPDC049548]|uniref:CAP domain-containing protein n=1 Tax=Actinoplanes sp. NPDC049548 TaxID=3155152 RepID=UPI00342E5EEA